MNEVVIVGAARTPIGDLMGQLKDVGPVDLALTAVKGALEKGNISPELVQEVALGMLYKLGAKGNPARQVQVLSGMPVEGYAYTIDQQCASGMKAFELISQSIMLGKTDVGVAVGTESMTNAPYLLLNARSGYRMGNAPVIDSMLHDGLVCCLAGYHMGMTAENLAEKYGITREEQDALSVRSHQNAVAAIEKGTFDEEIVPVIINSKKGPISISRDEHPRSDVTMESLGKLRPAFKKEGGTVTAGNASSVNDGSAALVLMSKDKAAKTGAKPLARVVATANYGVDPKFMGIGPAYAIPKVCDLAGISINDIGYFEINEAFAAQFLACDRELKLDMSKVNTNGSGVGLGHPVGCTGARILVSLIYEMRRRGVRYGCASLCVGGGPAMATILELM